MHHFTKLKASGRYFIEDRISYGGLFIGSKFILVQRIVISFSLFKWYVCLFVKVIQICVIVYYVDIINVYKITDEFCILNSNSHLISYCIPNITFSENPNKYGQIYPNNSRALWWALRWQDALGAHSLSFCFGHLARNLCNRCLCCCSEPERSVIFTCASVCTRRVRVL